jgi:putative flavoprotein involved in K+ transport
MNETTSQLPLVTPSQTHFSAIVIGGGQAGLSASYLLKDRAIDHVIFEKNRIAESWRSKRWDTFCLVTPNWQCQLPGHSYAGPDPNGFMVKDEIVEYIESYALAFQPPVYEGVAVSRLRRDDSDTFEVTTDLGVFTADQVIVATGGYQDATVPRMAERLPLSCRPAKCSWLVRDNPAARSQRICISPENGFICASAALRGRHVAIAART